MTAGNRRCAPRILQRVRSGRRGWIPAGSKCSVHRDDLRDSARPRRHGECSSLVGRCRGRCARCRRLYFALDAQRHGGESEGRAERFPIRGKGLVGASGEHECSRVMEGELGFILGAGVHQLHVADGGIVARHELDVLVRGTTRVWCACGFAHRPGGIDDGQGVDELAVLG